MTALEWKKLLIRPSRQCPHRTLKEEQSMPPIQHFAAPAGLTTPPLSFATRTGDLLFVSGIPGFDESGAIPDRFEAQFGFVVRNIKLVGWVEPLRNLSHVAVVTMGFASFNHPRARE
jgi:hypothetical protein